MWPSLFLDEIVVLLLNSRAEVELFPAHQRSDEGSASEVSSK